MKKVCWEYRRGRGISLKNHSQISLLISVHEQKEQILKFLSPSITIYTPYALFYLLLAIFPSGNHHAVACVYEFFVCSFVCFLLNPFYISNI